MKIGFDISAQSLPRSGVGQYQINLLNTLLKIDKENFYNLYAFNFRNRERFADIKFPSENYRINVIPIPQRLITAWWLLASFPLLESLAGECDIYHVSEVCIQPAKKAKSVAFIHDLTTVFYPHHHVKSNVFLHGRRFKNIHKVDAVLTNSEYTKKDIVEYLHVNPEKVIVTHLGADERFCRKNQSEVQQVLRRYNLTKPYILFVGTLEPRKNIKTLIKAFDNLKNKYKMPHQLILAGQAGWFCEEIFEAISSSVNKSDIRHLGYILDEDVPVLMNGAQAFAYPSFYEGFGLPILEAMQCGVPVIASATSSMPEVGGNACIYINPDDVNDLSEKIYTVISDENLRKELSEKGIERAKNFSWEKCARKTLRVYEGLCGGI